MRNVRFSLLNNLKGIICGRIRKLVVLFIIFIRFGSNLYRQIVGIPMGVYCAPLVVDLFCFVSIEASCCL